MARRRRSPDRWSSRTSAPTRARCWSSRTCTPRSVPDAGTVRAVDGVSFEVDEGKTLGIVGESGSGKTVLSRSIMGLLPPRDVIRSGTVHFAGHELTAMSDAELRQVWGAELSMIFQDPMTALNPVKRIGVQIAESLIAPPRHGPEGGRVDRRRAAPVGRHPLARAAGALVPVPAVGRHAPAGDDRHRPGLRPPPGAWPTSPPPAST